MITKTQILAAGSKALTETFRDWLDEHREPILQIIAQAVVNAAPRKPADKLPQRPNLTVAEVARRWNYCVHTVHRKVRTGKIPTVMLSRRRILIPLEAVLKFERDATIGT
jgi:excisionase family DNA binding protein